MELEVDPELEVEVLEATDVKDEPETMAFSCKNWSTVSENGASFGSACASFFVFLFLACPFLSFLTLC